MRITETGDLWWKNAVIYSLDVEAYNDGNGDGVGDFNGLAGRIDYLAELGVTCLWLMPFFPSPDKDDGYDITDFYGVDPRLGSLGDFVEVTRTAHDRGIRVIIDLVINHTSDQHPWFTESRKSTDNPYRDWYVWRSDTPPDTSDKVVFPDQEDSIWEKDDKTGEWYLHNFYRFQPDLNIANPKVRDEILKIIGFWAELGVDGFRIDAVPFIFSTEGNRPEEKKAFGDPQDFLRDIRALVGRRIGDGIILGEVNIPYPDQYTYFGGEHGDGLTMQFDFIGMQATYLSLARQDPEPLLTALKARPTLSHGTQWANFLRNHDELTLDKLSDSERQEVFDAFGPEPEMQVYGRGLKRRLPSMLDGDPRRIRMAYSLLFSLPGTPSLFYGEEIGMGEVLSEEGRMAVRTPMQWTSQSSAGFSTAPVRKLVAPLPKDGYSPEHVNVADQRYDRESLYAFMRELIFRYRQHPELGWGRHEVLEQPHRSVLALRIRHEDSSVVTVHNLGAEGATVELTIEEEPGSVLVDIFGGDRCELQEDGRLQVVLDGYGFRWYGVHGPHDRRLY
ncbi:alpha-amylase family protein [Arsenicicoccus sp. oral taxon 190]|uniref:alpha-amylase family protein n=1 Tax=Arsenicicoccus sp. oral taxon 190 TaxID=1658671 RepID=UPI00067A1296|nr:alpha-amylase family protein [Arsenicicoccus sp. oral taxon 190]AKT52396.1 trehalose synthase [Arsenicicoccus sp. oral taxon 190]